jgi:hypothetical protein
MTILRDWLSVLVYGILCRSLVALGRVPGDELYQCGRFISGLLGSGQVSVFVALASDG